MRPDREHMTRETPELWKLLRSLPVFNHEPGATTSRDARLTRSPLPLVQSLPALARVIVVRANPVPAGLCRRVRHESAQARHENLYPLSSMARKCLRGFIERASRREGLVDQNASDKIDTPISGHWVFEEGPKGFRASTGGWKVFVSRGTRVFATETRAYPRGAGVGRMLMSRAKAEGFESSDDGRRPNRALRDARGSGSWFKSRENRNRMTSHGATEARRESLVGADVLGRPQRIQKTHN
jgi:hypothetical protein